MRTDDPQLKEMERSARGISDVLRKVLPPGLGFILHVFTYEPGWSTYISTASRRDCIRELRALADRLERESPQ